MVWNWWPFGGVIGTSVGAMILIVQVAVLCMAVLRPHRSPTSRVAWVAVIVFLPLVGVIAYLFLGETDVGHDRVQRLREAEEVIGIPAVGSPPALGAPVDSLFALIESINGFGPSAGNSIVLDSGSEQAIDRLVADIASATTSVHLSFYIWLDDVDGGEVADAVASAAKRGVACRVMVDALGSHDFIRSPRWAQLREAGAQLVAALNDIPRLGHLAIARPDLRNHRKIAVIDGSIAYCGSRNCADAAFEVEPKFAPWVDVLFRCQGPVVAQEQTLFLTSWMEETGEQLPCESRPSSASDGVVAAMFGTGPTTRAGAMSEAFVATIATAREQLVMTTPYFDPDAPLLQAICSAAYRGVNTTLILPERNNSRLVAATARSWYSTLLSAGVQLYEYPLGLLHSKTITADGRVSLVGSANMDRRSLELNYENNLLVDSRTVTSSVLARQREYLEASHRITMTEVSSWSVWRRLGQNAAAMLSPIL